MGIGPRISTSALAPAPTIVYRDQPLPNPNPLRWSVVRSEVVGLHLIALVHYPDCTNFEGVKLLMFPAGVALAALRQQGGLDPHFSDDPDHIHPIARFEPTDRGWAMAEAVARSGAGHKP